MPRTEQDSSLMVSPQKDPSSFESGIKISPRAGESTQEQAAERKPLLSSIRSLQKVRSPFHMGYYASANENFAAAHFTRDSVKAARDMLDVDPQIAEETILTIVKYQATAEDVAHPLRDAVHVGDAHHEHRDRRSIRKLKLNPSVKNEAIKTLQKLGTYWGGTLESTRRYRPKHIKEVTYYGAADTTPESARLIPDYHEEYPHKAILDRVVKRKKEKVTVKEGYIEAMTALVASITESDLGLREFSMKNKMGIKNKFWGDSASSLLFANGESANHNGPIAEIGVQGITYDAFKKAEKVLTSEEINAIASREKVLSILSKEKVQEVFNVSELDNLLKAYESGEIHGMDVLARVIQKQVLARMWNKDINYFAPALDRDPTTGAVRPLDTIASNGAALLNTKLLEEMPELERRMYVEGIVKTIMSGDFLTDVGIRGRSVKHYNLVPFSDYHGAATVWTKETSDISEGLLRHGFHKFAEQLRFRMINGVNIAGSNFEFFYVDEHGNVNYDPHGKRSNLVESVTEKHVFYGTNIPEPDQTWTGSSINKAKRMQVLIFYNMKQSTGWQKALEDELLPLIKKVDLLKTQEEIEAAFPTHIYHIIDLNKGKELDSRFNAEWWNMEKKKQRIVA